MEDKYMTKTARIPVDLIRKVEKDAREQSRTFTGQVIYILRSFYEKRK